MKDSLSANNHHGLRRTGPDKHNVVQIVRDDPEWGRGTLREIATLTGTSHAFVRKIKKERDKAQKSQAIDSTTTTDEPPITSTPDMPGDLPEVLDEDESKHDAIGEPLAPPNDGGISVGKRVQLPPTTSSTLESILAQLRTLPLEGEDWSASDYDREILQHLIEECRRLNKTLTRKITFDVAPLRDFMDQRSLDMTTTGKLLGVSHAAVSRWLSGKSNPDGKSLTKILELVELSAEELQTRLEATRQAGDA